MPIYALGEQTPDIHPDAYVHPDAVVIGDVRVRAGASIWPGSVLRGDSSYIEVGARSSVQDGTVIHCDPTHPTIIGEGCVVGHVVHLEGCTIGDGALVGSGAVVLNGAQIGAGALVAANAVVSNDVVVPPLARAIGIPATIKEAAQTPGQFEISAQHYVDRGATYKRELRRLD